VRDERRIFQRQASASGQNESECGARPRASMIIALSIAAARIPRRILANGASDGVSTAVSDFAGVANSLSQR